MHPRRRSLLNTSECEVSATIIPKNRMSDFPQMQKKRKGHPRSFSPIKKSDAKAYQRGTEGAFNPF